MDSKTQVRARTLESLLKELGYEEQVVATAVNREFVRSMDRVERFLREGDAVEILAPRQGG